MSTPITPDEMNKAADTVAQNLLGLPTLQRIGILTELKQDRPTFHALVKKRLTDIRESAQKSKPQN